MDDTTKELFEAVEFLISIVEERKKYIDELLWFIDAQNKMIELYKEKLKKLDPKLYTKLMLGIEGIKRDIKENN